MISAIPRLTLVMLAAFSPLTFAGNVAATIVDGQGKPLPDAVIYAMPAQPVKLAKPTTVIIDQVDKEFVPRVSVIQSGTAVDFPNHDNIRHQVYSFSAPKTFQLKLYSGRPGEPVVFDKPGVIVLGCNIHDHMIAWVLSVDTPWFARSSAQGQVQIANVPAGRYELFAWHPGVAAPVSQGQVDVEANGTLQRSIRLQTGALIGATHGGHNHEHGAGT